jgi:hypothetical protein
MDKTCWSKYTNLKQLKNLPEDPHDSMIFEAVGMIVMVAACFGIMLLAVAFGY